LRNSTLALKNLAGTVLTIWTGGQMGDASLQCTLPGEYRCRDQILSRGGFRREVGQIPDQCGRREPARRPFACVAQGRVSVRELWGPRRFDRLIPESEGSFQFGGRLCRRTSERTSAGSSPQNPPAASQTPAGPQAIRISFDGFPGAAISAPSPMRKLAGITDERP
jgi:hypothetical protein